MWDFAGKGVCIALQGRKRMDPRWCKGCRNDHQAHLLGSVSHPFGNTRKQVHGPKYSHSDALQSAAHMVSHHTWQVLNPWCQVLSSVSQRQPKLAIRPLVPGLYYRGSTGGFPFSLNFCLFLNVPRLAQQLGSPWLQGLCCQHCSAPQPLKPRQPLLSPRAGQSERMWPLEKDTKLGDVSVSEAMKYLIPALWDMHHHRFAYLLLSDSSGWQGRWQLTHINPAAQHELSLHSRNPSLVFKHQGGVLVPDTKPRQHLHCKVNIARVSWRGGSPGRTLSPSSASSASSSGTGPWAAQHQGYTLCPHCWPAHTLMDQNEREVWTNIACLGCGRVEAFTGAFPELHSRTGH